MRYAFDSYSSFVGSGESTWIDLEDLIEKTKAMIENDCASEIQKGILSVDIVSKIYTKVKAPRHLLTIAFNELAMNAYKFAKQNATKEHPGRVSLQLDIKPSQHCVDLTIANTSSGSLKIPVVNETEDGIINDRQHWMSITAPGRGLANVWMWINELLVGYIKPDLIRFKRKADNMIVMGIRLTGDKTCLSFTPGDRN
jgi:hypothetical protein